MNSTQMACLQKLINTLQECECNGLTFSYASLMLNVEDEESQYLEYLSAQKLFELLDFIDGCGITKKKNGDAITDKEYQTFWDDGSRVGDHTAYVDEVESDGGDVHVSEGPYEVDTESVNFWSDEE